MLSVWERVIEPAAYRHKPDIILCSAGGCTSLLGAVRCDWVRFVFALCWVRLLHRRMHAC